MNIPSITYIDKGQDGMLDHYFKTIVPFSHIMGTVTGIVTDYVLSAFDKKYFTAVWNTKEAPYRQRAKSFKDFMMKPRPLLAVDEKFDPSEDANFRSVNEFDQELPNDPVSDIKYGIRNSVTLTDYPNFQLYYRPRRYPMTFTMTFLFDSDIQSIQCQQFIRQSIRHKMPITGHRYIENVIPDNFIKAIAKMNSMDYKSDEFIDWLNHFSSSPIKRRIRTGSGNMEFFASIKTPIEMIFTDAPANNGPIRRGNITVGASFTETVKVEFAVAAVYFLKASSTIGEDIQTTVDAANQASDSETMNVVAVTDNYEHTVSVLPDIDSDNFVKNNVIVLQAEKNGDDTINLLDIITDNSLLDTILSYKKLGKEIDFIKPVVMEGLNQLDSTRISYDSKNLVLTIKDMDMYKAYYLNVYVNKKNCNNYIDAVVKTDARFKIKFQDNPKIAINPTKKTVYCLRGENYTFQVTPFDRSVTPIVKANGNLIAGNLINGVHTYTIPKIDEDIIISTELPDDETTYTIKMSDDSSVNAFAHIPCSYADSGESTQFTVSVDLGYKITSVKANSVVLLPVDGVYTISNISNNQEITIETAKLEYDVSIACGSGAIVKSKSVHAYYNESYNFTITLLQGYENNEPLISGVEATLFKDGSACSYLIGGDKINKNLTITITPIAN